jgi:hypothetical protein
MNKFSYRQTLVTASSDRDEETMVSDLMRTFNFVRRYRMIKPKEPVKSHFDHCPIVYLYLLGAR